MPSTLLDKRDNRPPSLLFFVSTGGHLLLLVLFLFEIGLPQKPQESAYSVFLISPQAASSFADSTGSVFPKSEEEQMSHVSQLTDTALVERVSEPAENSEPIVPPGLNDPEDCLLKKVTDICPDADLSCIAGYMAYCVRLF